jgi:PIN domain nuclease of toxin-antitoxin system
VSEAERPVLLDTHYWVWLQFDVKDRIAAKTLKAIDAAAASGSLLLSAISVWEVAMLEAKHRLQLFSECDQWVKRALATPGLTLVPLTPEIAIQSTRLPGTIHGDPSDRIIAATARVMGARLATCDEKLIDYARHRHILVC